MKKLFILLSLLFAPLTLWAQEAVTIQGSVGKLKALVQMPETKGKTCPLVVIMHGFSGNKNEPLHRELADELQRRGIASIRFDFNGHGESEGEFQDMTILNEIEDAKAVIRYAQSQPWVGCISISGHSQGGVVASMVGGELGQKQIRSVLLYAPAAVLRDDALRGNILGARFNPDSIPDIVHVWGRPLGRGYIESVMPLPIYETAVRFEGPACIVHGENDRIVPYTYGACYAREYKHGEWHLQPADDHGFNRDRPAAVRIGADFMERTLK